MKYGVFFLLMTALGLGRAADGDAAGLLAAWAAAGCALFAAAYLAGRPLWLGKRPDGQLSLARRALVLPLHLVFHAVMAAEAALVREDAWNEVRPGLFLGRRPGRGPLPEGVEHVVDLTAEFPVAPGLPEGAAYTTCPTLDGTPTDLERLDALVAQLAEDPRCVYVHCAQGRGRSALVVAAVLLARGEAADPEAAEAALRAVRPSVRLAGGQRRRLEEWWGAREAAPPDDAQSSEDMAETTR